MEIGPQESQVTGGHRKCCLKHYEDWWIEERKRTGRVEILGCGNQNLFLLIYHYSASRLSHQLQQLSQH